MAPFSDLVSENAPTGIVAAWINITPLALGV
jgi:hypothetical protein